MLEFTLPGAPVPKGRHRTGQGRFYTPADTVAFEKAVALQAKIAWGGKPLLTGPVALTLTAYVPVPPSWSKKRQALAHDGGILPTPRPDLDNYVKAVKDALNGIVYRDDSQVCDEVNRKRYSRNPRTAIAVAPIYPEEETPEGGG